MKIVSFSEAISYIQNDDLILIGGSGGGHAVPEGLIKALQSRFLKENTPQNLTLLHPVGIGDMVDQGVSRLAYPNLLKRIVTGALVNTPAIQEMAKKDEVEAYTLPQGSLSQLMREMASGRPGLLSKVGLHTFVDPRNGGGRQSESAKDDLVKVMEVEGNEWLFYKPYHVDIAFLRGTTADEMGNITMEKEAVFGEMLPMAQATKRGGGVVIVQVERLAKYGTLNPKDVKIPGMLVDLVVVEPDQMQTYKMSYSPSYSGELRVPLSEIKVLDLDARKVIARRAAMELFPGAICNLGAGVSTGISNIAAEEGFLDQIVLTNEQGLIGGAPASGSDAGAAMNYDAMIDQPYQFDFYDGGGLDLAFLSFAQVDPNGSVNVSRFGEKIIGIGGFQNIAQNGKKVVFSGTFTAGGLDITWQNGKTLINNEGKFGKFVDQLDQISFNGKFGFESGQEIIFITERAVFTVNEKGMVLSEVAPGIDLGNDILDHMGFKPQIADDLELMDERLFLPGPMNYAEELLRKPQLNLPNRLKGLPEDN
ncbi:MAG: 3-oxoacid CoA-transferase [Chloroflexi bacterium]|nr:3-oxoacid CoA-transferase [Chloroflexota bacterium]MBT4682348.1 3-oxoacid CoA-transferase [Chloroflexota bacterium]MBT4754778.1 3-oxoacid CoA-transferase [Chloroflexota bacterium]MBT5337298.1 3-oxoacid CoA-transferase [Chloroflexota bacterium]MBT6358788.1 3-oxoacid CoA-transferase [Chloroflexota bacterium]